MQIARLPKDDHLVARLLARCPPLALADRVRSAKEREELARRYADAAMAVIAASAPAYGPNRRRAWRKTMSRPACRRPSCWAYE